MTTDTSPGTPKSRRPDNRTLRAAARLYAVQALFQMEAAGQSADSVRVEFETHRIGVEDRESGATMAEADLRLFRQILDEAVNWQASIDQLTDRALVARWPIARIDPTLRALFRAAGAELTQTTTPPKVVINEYVDVARAFFPEGREPKFVNAVLDHMGHEARPDDF